MTHFLDVCQQAARAGGQVLRDLRGRINPREKGPKDLVTEADFASQQTIHDIVTRAFPDHGFVGEEDHASGLEGASAERQETREYCWVVDPLDGTLNYVHQLPNYSVSVALRRGGSVLCGTVYDPVLDECFCAELEQGATLNGSRIRTSTCVQMDQALVAASLPVDIPAGSAEVTRFLAVMHSAQSIRRMGSAALNLCYLAMGRLDAYWATCVKSWDVAAGQLIVREAGGTVTHLDGTAFDLDRPQFVAAATRQLHRELRAVLHRSDG